MGQVAFAWSPSRAAAEKEAKRRPVFYMYMNLWPFVAVLLVLLVIFMVKPQPLHDIPIDLPTSSYSTRQLNASREDAIKISITRDGRVYFRNTMAFAKALPILIRGTVQEGAERKVYLAVGSRAKYGDAAAVVNEIGEAGIRDICFLAYKREK